GDAGRGAGTHVRRYSRCSFRVNVFDDGKRAKSHCRRLDPAAFARSCTMHGPCGQRCRSPCSMVVVPRRICAGRVGMVDSPNRGGEERAEARTRSVAPVGAARSEEGVMHRSSFRYARPLAVMIVATTLLGAGDRVGAEPTAQGAERFAQLETFARTAQQQWDVPGRAVAIVKSGGVICAKGFGVKRRGGTEPVDADTVFQIGSTSKAFTAAVVAMQVDAGNVGWSDRVIDHLPAFEMHDPWVTREFQ